MREPPESKPKSTNSDETEIEPGDAPIAVDSPNSILGKQDSRGPNSPNIISIEKVGPWLIVLTALSAISLTIVGMMLIFGERYMDAKIAVAVAQAETRIRGETAQETAEANAVAHTAETHARVALDKVETAEVELGKKGIDIRTDGH